MERTYKDIAYTLRRSDRKTDSIYIERDGSVTVMVPHIRPLQPGRALHRPAGEADGKGPPQSGAGPLLHHLCHQKGDHCLRAMILVGVSTLAELVVSQASPFNVADELTLPYFTLEEVQDLMGQYEDESGQPFAKDVIEAVYENTKGQPGLVCGICEHMTEAVATDRAKPIRTEEVIDGKRIITDIIPTVFGRPGNGGYPIDSP